VTTKADLVKKVRNNTYLSQPESAEVVEFVLETIRQSLENGEDVKLSGFGHFKVNHKSERIGRNPKTGEEMMISARKVVTFKASALMKDRINNI